MKNPDLIANMYHEMSGSLTVIRESIAIVLKEKVGGLNERQRHFLSMSERNLEKTIKASKDLFAFHQLSSGMMDLDMGEYDLNAVIENARKAAKPLAEKKGVDILFAPDKDLPKAFFDRTMIAQAVYNILHNAVEYTEKGNISITAAGRDNSIQVSVLDTGRGIGEKELSGLKEIFEKESKNYAEPGDNIGLGLTVAKEIISRHKGKIWVESEPGKGSVFYLSLPISV